MTVVDIESDKDSPTTTRATTVSATEGPTSIIALSPAGAGASSSPTTQSTNISFTPLPVPSSKQLFVIPSHRQPGNNLSYCPTFLGGNGSTVMPTERVTREDDKETFAEVCMTEIGDADDGVADCES